MKYNNEEQLYDYSIEETFNALENYNNAEGLPDLAESADYLSQSLEHLLSKLGDIDDDIASRFTEYIENKEE